MGIYLNYSYTKNKFINNMETNKELVIYFGSEKK